MAIVQSGGMDYKGKPGAALFGIDIVISSSNRTELFHPCCRTVPGKKKDAAHGKLASTYPFPKVAPSSQCHF